MRVQLIPGHSTHDGGAVRVIDGVQEYAWNLDLAHRIHDLHPQMFEIFHRRGELEYGDEIADVYRRGDAWGCDLSLELHFNGASRRVTGTETFSSGSTGSLAYARAIHPAIVGVLGLRDRGIKIRNNKTGGRGHESLVAGRAPALLLEPYFGSNANDCRRADECKQQLAEAIYCAVRSMA